MSLEVTREGNVIVRAPYRMPQEKIQTFVEEKKDWISRQLQKSERHQQIRQQVGNISEAQRRAGIEDAKIQIAKRVAYYAKLLGVTYGRITIRDQKTRWGSCGSQGNLNFTWKLVLTPPEVLDYVVVHELCHRIEMNHSQAFWAQVERVMPDYGSRRAWLKENGWMLEL
jgi:predicted metal-dependent hydrolase